MSVAIPHPTLLRRLAFLIALLAAIGSGLVRGASDTKPSPTPAGRRDARPTPTSPPVNPDSLPSTVSPAIAQFMAKEGKDLLESAPPLEATPIPTRAAVSTVRPAPARVAQAPVTPDVPAASPARPTLDQFRLKSAPLESTDLRFPLNLATALRLADARPLVVAMAQAGVWVAEAQLTKAKVIWVPTAVIGFDYIRHDGGGPDFNKGIMTAPSVNYLMVGSGANIYVNLTDAYFEPLVARQNLNAAHWDVQSAKNDTLMRTADSYFRVHQYRGMYAGGLYVVEQAKILADRVGSLSSELVPKDEFDRAKNMLADLEQRTVSARENWRLASADLTQTLRLDPRAVVVPLEHDHAQVTLIDPARGLDDLLPIALMNRPELAAYRSRVMAAEARVRREKARPVVPNLLVNGFQHAGMQLQSGLFLLGPNSSLNQSVGRNDVSVQLIWQLEGLGFGNLARIKEQRGRQSEAIIALRNTQDQVARDVIRAQARVQSAAARIARADRGLRAALITFQGHLEGLQQTRRLGDVLVLTFRPQEAVYSLDQLNISFNEYFATVAEYNRAQFELFHSLGYPAVELSQVRSVGEPLPIDTNRPGYLPPVTNGPPAATR